MMIMMMMCSAFRSQWYVWLPWQWWSSPCCCLEVCNLWSIRYGFCIGIHTCCWSSLLITVSWKTHNIISFLWCVGVSCGACIDTQNYTQVHSHMHACMHTCTHTHTNTCMHALTHVRAHTHTHTCTYPPPSNSRTHIHTHTHSLSLCQSHIPSEGKQALCYCSYFLRLVFKFSKTDFRADLIANLDLCCAENASEQLMYVLFWGSATAISMAIMMLFGTTFVDQPRLTQDKVKME